MDTVAVHSCPVCDKNWTVLKAYLQSAISSEWWYIYTSAACYACDKYSCTVCDKNSSSSDNGFYDFLITANAEWESQKLNAKISSALLQQISLLVVANIYPKRHRFKTSSWPSKLWMHPKFVPIDRAAVCGARISSKWGQSTTSWWPYQHWACFGCRVNWLPKLLVLKGHFYFMVHIES